MTEQLTKQQQKQLERLQQLQNELATLRKKILLDLENYDEVRASDYKEWTSEMRDFIRQQVIPENFVAGSDEYSVELDEDDFYVNGQYSFGRSFRTQFTYIDLDGESPDFHCYATRDNDILFTYADHRWIESKGMYDFEQSNNLPQTDNTETTESSNAGVIITVLIIIVALIVFLVTKMGF